MSNKGLVKVRDGYAKGIHTDAELAKEAKEIVGKQYEPKIMGKSHTYIDRDWRKVWSHPAECFLIQLVQATDRDENWTAVAARINENKFTYQSLDDYGNCGAEGILHVQPMHAQLYYDRQIQHKYPDQYCKFNAPHVPFCDCTIA